MVVFIICLQCFSIVGGEGKVQADREAGEIYLRGLEGQACDLAHGGAVAGLVVGDLET